MNLRNTICNKLILLDIKESDYRAQIRAIFFYFFLFKKHIPSTGNVQHKFNGRYLYKINVLK